MNDSLPSGYTRGVLITGFPGLVKYQGREFLLYDQLISWDALLDLPLKSIIRAFSDQALCLARRH